MIRGSFELAAAGVKLARLLSDPERCEGLKGTRRERRLLLAAAANTVGRQSFHEAPWAPAPSLNGVKDLFAQGILTLQRSILGGLARACNDQTQSLGHGQRPGAAWKHLRKQWGAQALSKELLKAGLVTLNGLPFRDVLRLDEADLIGKGVAEASIIPVSSSLSTLTLSLNPYIIVGFCHGLCSLWGRLRTPEPSFKGRCCHAPNPNPNPKPNPNPNPNPNWMLQRPMP